MKLRKMDRELKSLGFRAVKQGATSHVKYRHPDGRHITIPVGRKEIHPMMGKRLLKEAERKRA